MSLRSWSSPARWALGLVVLLLFIASSRLPVESSTHRFGRERSKKARSCPSEQSGASLQLKIVQRSQSYPLGNDSARSLPKFPDPSFQALSPLVESRLALGDRRPEYLKFFAPSSPQSYLPPPPAE
ncbi:MAG TPA: hypothetical protein VMU54_24265 [Planctomycetota bacterium]|nr:hypothetical protein [Planctomycetota bacterium]